MTVEVITPEVEVYNIKQLIDSLPRSTESGKYSTTDRLVEYIGRVCYNSYDKLSSTSFIDFNGGAAKKSHRSIFEFSNCKLMVYVNNNSLSLLEEMIANNMYFKLRAVKHNDGWLVSIVGSIRAFIELLENFYRGDVTGPAWLYITAFDLVEALGSSFFTKWSTYSELYSLYRSYKHFMPIGEGDLPRYFYEDITHLTGIKGDFNKKMLIRIVSDKGLHNELVRHRPFSIMAESQRYVRYGIGENSKNAFKVCIASCHATDKAYAELVQTASERAFDSYIALLANGYPAQQARATLPVGTAMTYFMYADIEEFNHFFSLRTAKTALPMAQEVCKEARDQMVNKGLI